MSAELERRYLRLLALYPKQYRLVYEQEMLGVLMTGAKPGQRRPRLREASNLVVSAAWARLRNPVSRTGDSPWLDAAAVLSVIAPMLLFARHARLVTGIGATLLRYPSQAAGVHISVTTWARITCWAAVSLAVLGGWRVVAAGLAWAGVVLEIGHIMQKELWRAFVFPDAIGGPNPGFSRLDVVWPLLLALIAAGLLSLPVPARRGVTLLGRAGTLFVATASAAIAVSPIAVVYAEQSTGATGIEPGIVIAVIPESTVALIELIAYGFTITFVALAALRCPPRVRRRVVTLLLSAGAMLSVIRLGPNGAIAGVAVGDRPILREMGQWLALATLPVLPLIVGAFVIRWRERGKTVDS